MPLLVTKQSEYMYRNNIEEKGEKIEETNKSEMSQSPIFQNEQDQAHLCGLIS